MTNANKPSRRAESANRLPISKKAYLQYKKRFETTFIDCFSDERAYARSLEALDYYLAHGSMMTGLPVNVLLAFMMVAPEIDKSIARSKAARERAARRKSQSALSTPPMAGVEVEEPEMCLRQTPPDKVIQNKPKQRPVLQRVKHRVIRKNRGNYVKKRAFHS